MLLNIRVVPKASRNLVKRQDDNFKVYLTKPAQKGLANEELIECLAKYFKIKKYQVRIIKGINCRDKVVELDAPNFSPRQQSR